MISDAIKKMMIAYITLECPTLLVQCWMRTADRHAAVCNWWKFRMENSIAVVGRSKDGHLFWIGPQWHSCWNNNRSFAVTILLVAQRESLTDTYRLHRQSRCSILKLNTFWVPKKRLDILNLATRRQIIFISRAPGVPRASVGVRGWQGMVG